MAVTTKHDIQNINWSPDMYEDDFEAFATHNITKDVIWSFSPVEIESGKKKSLEHY